MKKLNVLKRTAIIAIAAAVMSLTTANAQQQGDMSVGGALTLGTQSHYTNFGIGAKFLYNVTDPIRLVGALDFFPKKDILSMWDIMAYGHYLFPVADKTILYPSVGLGFMTIKAHYTSTFGSVTTLDSVTDLVFSLGGGVDYDLTDKLVLNGELKFIIKDGSRFHLSAGLAYKF